MPLLAIAALAAGTYVFRVAGPLSGNRLRVPRRLQHLLSAATAVLLTALVATAALTQGHGFAGWARPAGVLVAGALAIRRAPFPVVGGGGGPGPPRRARARGAPRPPPPPPCSGWPVSPDRVTGRPVQNQLQIQGPGWNRARRAGRR
jgi:branched-subunit amino acid transport protein